MKLIPQNNTVLCIKIVEEKTNIKKDGLSFLQENVPVYKIIDSALLNKDLFKIGDEIIIDSKPTKTKIDGTMYYIVKAEHIMGKLCF